MDRGQASVKTVWKWHRDITKPFYSVNGKQKRYNKSYSMLTERSINIEKVKRNLFGAPTKAEKSLFNLQYEKSLEEDRAVSDLLVVVTWF